MVKRSKLIATLDAHKGRDYQLEKQKKLQKQANKKKRSKSLPKIFTNQDDKENLDISIDGLQSMPDIESEGWESDESEAAELNVVETVPPLDDESDSDSSVGDMEAIDPELSEPDAIEADEPDIPLSDIESLSSEDKADMLPHQRLTINNTSALSKAHSRIAFSYAKIPFSAHQTITTREPISIPDVNDDLTRELAFYKQCLKAANESRGLLMIEGVPFSRPNDYFAEMVKSDVHMGKIRQKMVDEAASKKAASDARKQRDLRKFGKQVQVAKLQERDKAKRDTLDKIKLLKKKRKNMETGATNEEDLFDVALDDAAKENKSSKSAQDDSRRRPNKRQKKDDKFGFGGKKRFSKSGDAASSASMTAFSAKKMKGRQRVPQRLGKSRRAKLS